MAKENIKLTKTIYSAQSIDGLVDRSFSEFFKTKDPVNVGRFFSIYEELFYDIPKNGEKSHKSIIKQSQEYINDYFDQRDEDITTLTERIIELEEELAKPDEILEHPFYKNGTIISTDHDNEGIPDWNNMNYMDKGERRPIKDGAQGEVFKALIASLGYKGGTDSKEIAKVVPQIVFDGIPRGAVLDIEDLTGQTAAEELEQQTNILASIVVNNWRQELNDIIQPIEDGSISNQILYINQLKNRINSEFTRETLLEQNWWKYYQDSLYGFTEEDRNVGQQLVELTQPKLNRSRQTLAVLARIWAQKANFPNIDFNSILPRTQATLSNDGSKQEATDKGGNTIIINPLTDDEIRKFASGAKGREQFPGVLEGEDYIVSLDNLEYNGEDANRLLNQGIIKVNYEREKVDKRAPNGQAYTEYSPGDVFYYEPEDFWYKTIQMTNANRYPTLNYHYNPTNTDPQFIYGGNRRWTFLNYTYA